MFERLVFPNCSLIVLFCLSAPLPRGQSCPLRRTSCPCRTPPACSLSLSRCLHPILHTLALAPPSLCSGMFCFFCLERLLAPPMSVEPQLRPASSGRLALSPSLAEILNCPWSSPGDFPHWPGWRCSAVWYDLCVDQKCSFHLQVKWVKTMVLLQSYLDSQYPLHSCLTGYIDTKLQINALQIVLHREYTFIRLVQK